MRRCEIVALLMLAGLLPLSEQLLGQEKTAQKMIFHVTAVRSEEPPDWCTTGECSATRFTVEGYSVVKGDLHSTEYVLECIEALRVHPSPSDFRAVCDRLHANNEYDALLWGDSISFGDAKPTPDGIARILYKIVSEKEVNRHKR